MVVDRVICRRVIQFSGDVLAEVIALTQSMLITRMPASVCRVVCHEMRECLLKIYIVICGCISRLKIYRICITDFTAKTN